MERFVRAVKDSSRQWREGIGDVEKCVHRSPMRDRSVASTSSPAGLTPRSIHAVVVERLPAHRSVERAMARAVLRQGFGPGQVVDLLAVITEKILAR